jgi:23S rRNA (cytidine1920-2'-O)/16S rRNA (cytidine1409-2'-O)-methyltransferase
VIRDDAMRLACVEKIRNFVEQSGQQWLGHIPSPITGHDGNVEYLAHLRRVGDPLRSN